MLPARLLKPSIRSLNSCSAVFFSRQFSRSFPAPNPIPNSLVFVEHKLGKINSATLSALNAAQSLGGSVTGIITGSDKTVGLDQAIESAKNLPIIKLLIKQDDALEHFVAESLAPLMSAVVKEFAFTHLIGGQTSVTKNIFPRIAALLNVVQHSDVMKIVDPTTFVRPIYAGNAIATLKSLESTQVLTVRTASFEPIALDPTSASTVQAENISQPVLTDVPGAQWVAESLTKSERPELGSARRIVSGGRGLKNKEKFDKLITPLADKLDSAIGASRAAVDSGFADNSLQVGQTGKVVSPELYVAVGISGAIQHLAGMKDSKTIVAINKDPEAPIFQVADVGLVGDLFEAVPELTKKI